MEGVPSEEERSRLWLMLRISLELLPQLPAEWVRCERRRMVRSRTKPPRNGASKERQVVKRETGVRVVHSPLTPDPSPLPLKRRETMRKLLMIVAMVGVIAMAGVAMASEYYSDGNALNVDFFDAASWPTPGGSVPGVGVDTDTIRFGELGARPNAIGSMVYDPATTGDPLDYEVNDGGGAGEFMLGRHQAGDQYTFTQKSGDLEFAGGYRFQIGYGGSGTYVLNGGIARFTTTAGVHLTGNTDAHFDQNAGDVIVTDADDYGLAIDLWDLGGPCSYNLGGGTLQVEKLTIDPGNDGNGVLNFDAGSTGILWVNESDQTVAGINALIGVGKIVDLGAEGFVVTDVGDYTEVKLDLPTAAPIPEPAGLGLIGLALLAVRRRRS